LNADLVSLLPTLQTETEIVSEKGRPLGVFTPIPACKLEPRISEEELLRRSNTITLNAELLSRLPTLNVVTYIVDEMGKPFGIYTPIPAWKLEPRISDEELLRRSNSAERGITTAELLAMLEKL
jgi:hypothetical protein